MEEKLKYRIQRFKKGYADIDIYNINDWFLDIFPKMLGELAEKAIGYPTKEEELKLEVKKMPIKWLNAQKNIINSLFYKKGLTSKYDIEDPFCCWLIILLRMKYCFEMSNNDNEVYEIYNRNKMYEKKHKEILKNYEEAFYLFKQYFFGLWD